MKYFKSVLALLAAAGISQAEPIVTINGVDITQDEILQTMLYSTQGKFRTWDDKKKQLYFQRFLQERIDVELIYNDAINTKMLDNEDYKNALNNAMERTKRQLALRMWQLEMQKQVKIDDAELKKYYNDNLHEFNEAEKVHPRHILLKEKAKAEALIKELSGLNGDALKAKFIELATAHSTGPSAPNGGDLGAVARGKMVPEFDNAIFSMEVGTITPEPVETQFGFHVIYLEEKIAPRKLSFDEAKPSIMRRLGPQKMKELVDKRLEEVAKKLTIVDHTKKQ